MKIRTLAIVSLFAVSVASVQASTITENFATDPLQDGWQVFGNTNQFTWDAASNQLDVTWDSTQPNSYFYHPLGATITRDNDFSIAFDLRLNDIASGVEPGKTGPLQLGFGFLNFAGATSPGFQRGNFGAAPDVAEFDYYTHGFYTDPFFDSPAATTPAFISGVNSYDYAVNFVAVYNNELPDNEWIHVTFTFSAANQTAAVAVTTNGVSTGPLPPLVLNPNNGFADSDDYHADMFSISSYSSAGDDFDSVLAHGSVANVVVTVSPPLPIRALSGSFSGSNWQAQFYSQTNYLYTLQQSRDLQSWTDISTNNTGNGGLLFLQDTNSPADQSFYRIRADQQ